METLKLHLTGGTLPGLWYRQSCCIHGGCLQQECQLKEWSQSSGSPDHLEPTWAQRQCFQAPDGRAKQRHAARFNTLASPAALHYLARRAPYGPRSCEAARITQSPPGDLASCWGRHPNPTSINASWDSSSGLVKAHQSSAMKSPSGSVN